MLYFRQLILVLLVLCFTSYEHQISYIKYKKNVSKNSKCVFHKSYKSFKQFSFAHSFHNQLSFNQRQSVLPCRMLGMFLCITVSYFSFPVYSVRISRVDCGISISQPVALPMSTKPKQPKIEYR